MDPHLTLEGAIQDLTAVLEVELRVWVDGLFRSLCLTVRPHHVGTAIVVREDVRVTETSFRHARLANLNLLAFVVARN